MIFTRKKTALIVGLILGILILVKHSGILNWMYMPINTMEPNIQKNSTVLISNIPKIENSDIIIFRKKESGDPYVYRIVGMENDTILIKNGILYRNNKRADTNYEVIYDYKVSKEVFHKIKNSKHIYHPFFSTQIAYMDTLLVAADKNFAVNHNLTRYIIDKQDVEEEIKNQFQKNWNRDNFGPLIIPAKKCFVMGDNRGNSWDSRYFGLIDNNQIIGKVIF
ncbi:signal peptidase I [Salinimicrobium gaetbulicola]|uniref:Signal peptidase I n=1 Tax=Salinimicrobium gaetbulicola TaxID=999702 RepID=A0ABW3IBL0_9FLAO